METNNQPKQWIPCPKGEFARLSQRLGACRRRRAMLHAAGYVGVAAICAASGLTLIPALLADKRDPQIAHISCKKVLACSTEFRDGKLSGTLHDQILYHLHHCKPCIDKYREQGISVS